MLTTMSEARSDATLTIEPLDSAHDDAAIAVLVDAFAAYPSTAWIVAPCALGRGSALTALFGFFVAARRLRRERVVGAWLGGELVAVALASDPDGPPSPPALAARREALWGAGGALLSWLRRDAAEDGGGLSTSTEDPANLPFYERHGLRRVDTAILAEGIEVWGLATPLVTR